MVITNELFGLVQCYSEQGMCYFKDVALSPHLVLMSYLFMYVVIIGLVGAVIFSWIDSWRNKHVKV